jgi:hypothetical protein
MAYWDDDFTEQSFHTRTAYADQHWREYQTRRRTMTEPKFNPCPECGVDRKNEFTIQHDVGHRDGCRWLSAWSSLPGAPLLADCWKKAEQYWKESGLGSSGKPSPGASAPMVAAMILADVGYQDNRSLKFSLLGLFNKISPDKFPVTVGGCLFIRLVDGRGSYPLILRISEEETGLVLSDQLLTANFKNPLEPLDIVLPVTFTAGRPGTLMLSIVDKHTVIHSFRLPVEALKKVGVP